MESHDPLEKLHHHAAHLKQLRHDGQNFWVADVDGILPVGLFFVSDVSQVEDGRQQGEDPGERDQHLLALVSDCCGPWELWTGLSERWRDN